MDFEHFHSFASEPADLAAIPQPRAVYVGALDERFDFRAIQALALARPQWSIVLIGPRGGNQLWAAKLANVYFLGARPYEKIPGYLHHSSVALLPLSDHPANAGRSPMKIYEYGAAGLPVITVDTAELTRRNLQFVRTYRSVATLPSTVSAAFADREQLRASAVAVAREMSWKGRWDLISTFC